MTSVALATEDELSEAVGRRLLAGARHPLDADLLLRKGGSGYLRSRMHSWCALARSKPVLLLTDLDRWGCPSALIQDWLGKHRRPDNFVLRIAVREVEAWLLADHDAMRCLLGRKGQLPGDPDDLRDPKQRLLQLARNATRDVRRDLVAEEGAIAAQGMRTTRGCASSSRRTGIHGARRLDRRVCGVLGVASMSCPLVYMRDERPLPGAPTAGYCSRSSADPRRSLRCRSSSYAR